LRNVRKFGEKEAEEELDVLCAAAWVLFFQDNPGQGHLMKGNRFVNLVCVCV
jgi:hypothetical protein